jgi:hypothetical protein
MHWGDAGHRFSMKIQQRNGALAAVPEDHPIRGERQAFDQDARSELYIKDGLCSIR